MSNTIQTPMPPPTQSESLTSLPNQKNTQMNSMIVSQNSQISTESPEKLPTVTTTANSSSSNTQAAKPTVKRLKKVKTNGLDLFERMQARSKTPIPYPKCPTPFHLLPADIFAVICYYLETRDIIRLYMCGNRDVITRMTIGCGISRLEFEPRADLSWPSFVPRCKGLRRLDILNDPFQTCFTVYKCGDLLQLPSSLTVLSLECSMSESAINSLSSLSNLSSLSLNPNPSQYGISNDLFKLSSLPPNLTSFVSSNSIHPPSRDESLSFLHRLKELRLFRLETQKDDLASLPRQIEKLLIGTMNSGAHIAELPPSLTHLDINLISGRGLETYFTQFPEGLNTLKIRRANMTNSDFQILPQSITSLRVPKSELALELFAGAWPLPNLMDLKITGSHPGVIVRELPRNMKKLYLSGQFDEDICTMPPNLESLKMPDLNALDPFWQSLPKTLTTLELINSRSLTSDFLGRLPPLLKTLRVAGNFYEYGLESLPKTLTVLGFPTCTTLNGDCINKLPRSLIRFEICSTSFFPNVKINDFPPRLIGIWFVTNGRKQLVIRNTRLQEEAKKRRKDEQLGSLSAEQQLRSSSR